MATLLLTGTNKPYRQRLQMYRVITNKGRVVLKPWSRPVSRKAPRPQIRSCATQGPSTFLWTDHQFFKAVAKAWTQGHGFADGFSPATDRFVNKAAWNAFAAAHLWEKPTGALIHRTGYQWFQAANALAGLNEGVRNYGKAQFNPPLSIALAPAPTILQSDMKITALAFSQAAPPKLLFQPTPLLVTDLINPPFPDACAFCISAQAPTGSGVPEGGGASYAAGANAFLNESPAGSGNFGTIVRHSGESYPFDCFLPDFVICKAQYVHVLTLDFNSPDGWGIYGTPGPAYIFPFVLEPGFRF